MAWNVVQKDPQALLKGLSTGSVSVESNVENYQNKFHKSFQGLEP